MMALIPRLKLPGGWVIARAAPGPDAAPGTAVALRPDTESSPPAVQGPDTEAPATEPDAPAAKKKKDKPPKRPLLVRLFGVSLWGGFKLLVVCILVGAFAMLVEETRRATEENLGAATASLARQLWDGLGWAIANFWLPALVGAGIVLPVWVLWRVVTLPFRK